MWKDRQTEGKRDRKMDRRIGGWKSGWMDGGSMEGTDNNGRTAGWIDAWKVDECVDE